MAEKKDGHWMEKVAKTLDKGALHRETHTPAGQDIPESKLEKAEHSTNPTERRRATLAENFRNAKHK